MTAAIDIKKEDGKISVKSSYNASFVEKARELNGKWDSGKKVWVFDDDREEAINAALLECYGYTNDDLGDKVKVKIRAGYFENSDGEVKIGSILIAKRWDRDKPVTLYNRAYVIKGEFQKTGGSRNHPAVAVGSNIWIIVDGIPRTVIEKYDDKDIRGEKTYEILENGIDRDALEAEKEKLEKRLAEIEELLAK